MSDRGTKPKLGRKKSWQTLPTRKRPLDRKISPPFTSGPSKKRFKKTISPTTLLKKKINDLHSKPKPAKHKQPWSKKEDHQLIEMHKSKATMKEMMSRLKRTEGSITQRLRVLRNVASGRTEPIPSINIRYLILCILCILIYSLCLFQNSPKTHNF